MEEGARISQQPWGCRPVSLPRGGAPSLLSRMKVAANVHLQETLRRHGRQRLRPNLLERSSPGQRLPTQAFVNVVTHPFSEGTCKRLEHGRSQEGGPEGRL